MSGDCGTGGMRIDRLLCCLRFVKTRSAAQALVGEGHIRCNRQRVVRSSLCVKPGDVLTLPTGRTVRAVEVLSLPARRGSATEAALHYRILASGDAAGGLTADAKAP